MPQRADSLRSDQGTNFVGAKHELKVALAELEHERIKAELRQENCNWFTFAMNVPSSSYMGGVWERQIRQSEASCPHFFKTMAYSWTRSRLERSCARWRPSLIAVRWQLISLAEPLDTQPFANYEDESCSLATWCFSFS